MTIHQSAESRQWGGGREGRGDQEKERGAPGKAARGRNWLAIAPHPPKRPWPYNAVCACWGLCSVQTGDYRARVPQRTLGALIFTLFVLTAINNKSELQFSRWKNRSDRFQCPSHVMNGAVIRNKDLSYGCHCSFSSATQSNLFPSSNRMIPKGPTH